MNLIKMGQQAGWPIRSPFLTIMTIFIMGTGLMLTACGSTGPAATPTLVAVTPSISTESRVSLAPPTPTVAPTLTKTGDQPSEMILTAELDRPFQLDLGQTARIESAYLEIIYSDFVEDSRCPLDAECEWPGEIVIWIEAAKNGQNLGGFRLSTYNGQVIIDDYVVSVVEATDDYLFTLVVSEAETSLTSTTPTVSSTLHNCAYGYSDYFALQSETPEIHIIGFYETSTVHTTPGVANIYIERKGRPIVLVLSSYESTQWRLRQADGVTIEQIIVNGYEPQRVIGAGNIPVIDRSGEGNYLSACAITWPSDNEGCDTPALVAGVEALVGASITSFQGCYRATEFTLK